MPQAQFSSVGVSAVAQANAVLDVIDHFASAVRGETELAAYSRQQLTARVDGLYAEAEELLKSLLAEIAEYRRLEADPDADLQPEHYVCAPDTYAATAVEDARLRALDRGRGERQAVDAHERTSHDAALHGLVRAEVGR